jgi:hypothetical protein
VSAFARWAELDVQPAMSGNATRTRIMHKKGHQLDMDLNSVPFTDSKIFLFTKQSFFLSKLRCLSQ